MDGTLPVRMCNQMVYCPRLFHLEHVQGYFVESEDTISGESEHERQGRRGRVVGAEAFEETSILPSALQLAKKRTVVFESRALRVRGRFDLLELRDGRATVVEIKHGRAPRGSDHQWDTFSLPYHAWPGDVVQVGLYMAILREAYVPCDEAVIVYRKSRDRTVIPWSSELERVLHAVVGQARSLEQQATPPPPLRSSPKCRGCSLHPICLPDEYYALQAESVADPKPSPPDESVESPEESPAPRPVPRGDHRSTLHVLTPGATVTKDSDSLMVRQRDGTSQRVRLKDVSQVALYGPVHVTENCVRHLLSHDVTIAHHTGAGRLLGFTHPLHTRNVHLRIAQYQAAGDVQRSLAIAKPIVLSKLANQRTVLRRYRKHATGDALESGVDRLGRAIASAQTADTLDRLRGHEGDGAAAYFGALGDILPTPWNTTFTGRSRRPPQCPVNALLSFGYSLLTREAAAATARVGLDPMLGFLHTTIAGRPALSLDIMEPFRPSWIDTMVLRLLSTSSLSTTDFLTCGDAVYLNDKARRTVIQAFERRGDEMTTHPRLQYRLSYRRLLELEVRLLGMWLRGEVDHWQPMKTR